ncbi:preprotein translocase subunit SecF [Thermosulfidibacter takaii ABI70S6]|uniref:Protein-export membrane protein SecF n=1 Tax=Thermosulfidibacter takaii (strain DSM 17441 / JCM 13301 / NBRC 103674 / ABI70S6) TaxID=1298851 RepID=A0A0S3QSC7_THET7|nr:protein translocase subunit SecF [Thermosulfidibacter takaii]BAT71213.1 preprotein translocase subunit SecF [Thermosulfidibacter takaii ABI70S6]
MFQIIKPGTQIDFMRHKEKAIAVSLALIILSIGAMIYNKLTKDAFFNYGVDFAGGTLIQVKFKTPPDVDALRKALKEAGFRDFTIQTFGSPDEVIIRTPQSSGELKGLQEKAKEAISKVYGKDFEIRRVEMVGPKVGKELKRKGIKAIILSLIAMLIYIAWRFEFRFGIGAIVALFHDVTITAGICALFRLQMDLEILAALLTILGYSINDTIVVYDRIRENMGKKGKNMEETINISINETLSRTLLTSLTTLFAVLSLLILGNEVIRGFALALTIGIIVGTYSSIFIASPIVIYWERLWKKKRLAAGEGKA